MSIKKSTALTPTKSNQLDIKFGIPEPTISLLWITEEDVSKIKSASTISITITISLGESDEKDDNNNFYAEPSLIWAQLPVVANNELETKPMYYPSYSGLSPKHRFQYLNWLRDITKETNLSYVFLYYYGLERHLLLGDYDKAVEEILKLLQHHNKGTFKNYATRALLVASLEKKRYDIFDKAPFLLKDLNNESIFLRFKTGKDLNAKEVIELVWLSGLKNRYYLKKYPEQFEKELQRRIDTHKYSMGLTLKNLQYEKSNVFANLSIPGNIRIPQIMYDLRFKKVLNQLLTDTSDTIKTLRKSK